MFYVFVFFFTQKVKVIYVYDYNALKGQKCFYGKDFPSAYKLWDVVLAKPLEILAQLWKNEQLNLTKRRLSVRSQNNN